MRPNKKDERVFDYYGDPLDLEHLNGFIKRKLGNLCFVSSAPTDIDDFIGVGLIREEIIKDDLDQDIKVVMHDYEDVFKAYYDEGESGLKLIAPSSKIVHEKITERLDRRTISSEECVIDSMGEKLLSIPAVRAQMNPLFEIANYVAFNGSLDIRQIVQGHRFEKIRNYSLFLESLGIITMKEDMLNPGRKMDLELPDWGPESAFKCISKNIGRKELNILHSDFGFQNILPFIRMSNINCLSSFYIDKPLKWEPAMFGKNISDHYHENNLDPLKILNQAYSLQKAGIFKSHKKDSKILFSCEPVYVDFKNMAKKCWFEKIQE